VKRFISEKVGDDTLVYDTSTSEAHCLSPAATKRWFAARTNLDRRRLLALGAAAGVATILAPAVAEAASNCQVATCGRGDFGKTCNRAGAQCGVCVGRNCL
jgi:hypothetical protein